MDALKYTFDTLDAYRDNLKATKGDEFVRQFILIIGALAACHAVRDLGKNSDLQLWELDVISVESCISRLVTQCVKTSGLSEDDQKEVYKIAATAYNKAREGQNAN